MKYVVVLLLSALFISIVAAAELKKIIAVPSAPNTYNKANETLRQSHCYSNQYECSDGQCIDIILICNHHTDCMDGSDESFPFCFTLAGKTTSTTPRYIEISVDTETKFTCTNGEFLCTSGECILQSHICDGRNDCRDGSDEGTPLCNSNGGIKRQCLTTEFRCNSGECIHTGLRCDGSYDCFDSSDEDTLLCERASEPKHEPTISPHGVIPLVNSNQNVEERRLTPCNVPAQPANGRWKLHRSLCNSNEECDPQGSVRSMIPGTYLVYSCDEGFALNGSKDVLCGPGGRWIHETKCDEIRCHVLSSSATEALCTWNSIAVSCEIPVPIGTIAQLRCREGFVQEVIYEQTHKNVKCQPDGHWNPKPIQCVKKPKKVKLILTGDMIIDD